MGNNCSCLSNITSLCSEDLSRAKNDEDNNRNKNNKSRNIIKNKKVDNYESIISSNDIRSINSTNIKSKNITNDKSKGKNSFYNTTDSINNIEKNFKNYNNSNSQNKINAKLQKYILRIITKRKFMKNINKYKEDRDKLFNICVDIIYKSNELLLKAESACKIKYKKNGFNQFYENISKEEKEKMIYIPNESKTIENTVIIKYGNELERNINDINWIYKGQADINSIPNGYGLKYSKNGIKEEGYWKEGILTGWSQIIDYKGNIIMGPFDYGNVNGKGIKYSYLNNALYKGEIVNDKKEGKGEEITSEVKYSGYFMNDKKNGKGKMINNISGDIYEGNFKDDLFDGEGHYIYKMSGQEYKGEYKNGLMHGKGLYEWSQGEYYKGSFVNGKKEGNGEMHWADGRTYIGPFLNGRPQGIGIYDNGINYKGEMEFNNGKLNRDYISKNYETFNTNNSYQSSSEQIIIN